MLFTEYVALFPAGTDKERLMVSFELLHECMPPLLPWLCGKQTDK
jgi:hypothetical protein